MASSAIKLVAVYSILIGIFMIGFWSFAVTSDIVPPEEKPWGITFHLFSEFSTASLLIISGAGVWLNKDWARYLSLLALGMLMYIVIYSPGYYAQRGNMPMAFMFIVLIFLTIVATIALPKSQSVRMF
jgi:hypothetical protein